MIHGALPITTVHDALRNALLNIEPDVPEDRRRLVAWNNARCVPWNDPYGEWRVDQDGRYIHWHDYGKYVEYGWHVDHRWPLALGGRHNASNLMARHWLGNTQAGAQVGRVANALVGGRR